jgi:FKBP-type peptidyl-prolyl cis-trans isomerase
MTKVQTRLLSLASLLGCATLATGCFTPANYGAGAGEHGEEAGHAEAGHAEAGPAEDSVAKHAPAPTRVEGEKIVEGIIPGTTATKLEIKTPEIPFDPPFDGKGLTSKTLDNGVIVEEFVVGNEGEAVAENKLAEFQFKGFASVSARQVMGSRAAPAKMAINEATRKRDPIAAAMADAMIGMKAGGKRKVKIPVSIIEDNAPAGRPPIGDLWMTVEMISVTDAPVLAGAEAFAGEPIATKKLPNGLEIYDYAAGEGRTAKAGDQVVTHYIGQLTDGTEFDSSHSRAEGLPVVIGGGGVIAGFGQGLEGAKPGMLRKVVIPPELGYGERDQGKIPPNSTLVFMLQITEVKDAPPMPAMPGGMPGGAPPPRPPKPTEAKPGEAKPAKPAAPKPAKPADGE